MKKNIWKKTGILLACTILLSGFATGCQSEEETDTKTTTEAASEFQLDFVTGEYSFVGTEKGRTYSIRLYGVSEEGTEDEFYTFTSANILAEEDSDTYTGTVDLSADCTPGATYRAYVLTTTSDYKRGMSEAVEDVYIGTYPTPGTITSAVNAGGEINVVMDESVFEPYRELEIPPQSYTVTLYKDGEAADTVTVSTEELTLRDEDYEEGFGPMAAKGTYHHRSGEASFDGTGDGDYTVTIRADAQEDAYFESMESEPGIVGGK